MTEGRKSGARVRAWTLALAFALVPALAPSSSAAAPALVRLALADGSDEARLAAAAADLQRQLQRKTEEISELKRRSQRGLRADYDLRERMAEANDLARRLTALENELRAVRGRRHAGTAAPATAPAVVEPAAALEARADLLTDEARKLADRAAGMVRAAGQLRTRQTLRRRAVAVDRDPFAVLDGSKRLVLGNRSTGRDGRLSAPADTTAGAPGASNPVPTSGPESAQPVQPQPGTNNPPPPSNPMPANPMITPPGMAPPPPMPPPAAPGAAPAPGTAPAPTDPSSPAGGAPATDSNVSRPTTLSQPGASSQLAPGSLLDPALRAELARIESGAVGAGDVAALERAAAALSARAKALEAEAKALRARAATR